MRRLALGLAAAGLLSACGGGGPSLPLAPPGRAAPALVQVENAPQSRPHAGLQKADLVFEYLTEGGITRFSVIYFEPSGPARIGPVRSARLVSLRLQKGYGAVLFYSGASDRVLGEIYDHKLPSLTEGSGGGKYFSRDAGRPAPHNLFTTADQVRQGVQDSGQKVTYPAPVHGEPVAKGEPVARLSFDQTFAHSVSWTYTPADKTYGYSTETGPEVDTSNGGQPLRAVAVVLVRVAHRGMGYREDVLGEEGIDFDLLGTGPSDVYTRGLHLTASWAFDGTSPLKLTGADGKALALPEGLVWIHLVDPDLQVKSG